MCELANCHFAHLCNLANCQFATVLSKYVRLPNGSEPTVLVGVFAQSARSARGLSGADERAMHDQEPFEYRPKLGMVPFENCTDRIFKFTGVNVDFVCDLHTKSLVLPESAGRHGTCGIVDFAI